MGRFSHIDNDDMCPDVSQHVAYAKVYRATKNDSVLDVTDFSPWNIEHPNQMKKFRKSMNPSSYGVSLFTDLASLKDCVSRWPALRDTIKAYAIGSTSIKRGVSTKEDANHHVDYFLFDYMNNSPKDDFHIVEVRKL